MSKINRRLFLGGTASVAALAALAACAKNDTSGAAGGSEDGVQGMKITDRAELQQGGELKLSMSQTIANWNDAHVDGNGVSLKTVMTFINPGGLDFADDGSYSPNPDFYTKMEATEENGKTVVTLALNEKAVWGSGRAIDSEDIREALIHGNDEDYIFASTDGINKIEDVEIVNEREARIIFDSIYPDWAGSIGFAPKELFATAEAFNTAMAGNAAFNNDYFAGPFKVDSYDDAQQLVTLVPNEKWWGNAPLLDKVTFRVLDSSAEATAFANKSLDVIDYIISADVYQQCIGRADAEVRQNNGRQWRHFTINASSGPLADKAVRQAVVRATNRQAIAESDLAGLPVEPDKLLLGNRFFMTGQAGYEDHGVDWSYDLEAAKTLLEDAGWTVGSDGVREKDGQRLAFTFTIPAGTPTTENEANLLQASLREVGIEMTMNTVDMNGYFKEYIRPGNYEMTAFTWQGTQFPMKNIGQIYGTDSASNYSRQSVPEIDDYITKIASEPNRDERVRMTNEVDKLIWENVMNYPMYVRRQLTAVPINLANYGAVGLASFRAENIGYLAA